MKTREKPGYNSYFGRLISVSLKLIDDIINLLAALVGLYPQPIYMDLSMKYMVWSTTRYFDQKEKEKSRNSAGRVTPS